MRTNVFSCQGGHFLLVKMFHSTRFENPGWGRGNLASALDMVASYGRALAWSTELVSMLDVRARKICSEIGSHNSRSESTKVVAKLKSNKPTKVKTKFEVIKFHLEIGKFVSGN